MAHDACVSRTIDQAGMIGLAFLANALEDVITPCLGDVLSGHQNPEILTNHWRRGLVENVLQKRRIAYQHNLLVIGTEVGDVLKYRRNVDARCDHRQFVPEGAEMLDSSEGIGTTDPVAHGEPDHCQSRALVGLKALSEDLVVEVDALFKREHAAWPVGGLAGGAGTRRPRTGLRHVTTPGQHVQRIVMQVVGLGHGRNAGEILWRLDAFRRHPVATQEICIRRYFECGASEGAERPFETRGLNRHRGGPRPVIARCSERACPVAAGAEPGTGNLSPRVDDCKPLWMLFASSGRSFSPGTLPSWVPPLLRSPVSPWS